MKTVTILLSATFFICLINQAIAIKPDRKYFMTPDSVCCNYEQLEITTDDNLKLNS